MELLPGPPAWYEWDGERWYRNRQGYYQNRTGFLLHRALYERYIRPLRPGELVHHADDDPGNNALTNLEAVTPSVHNRLHPEKRLNLDASRAASILWASRQPRTIQCAECGADVDTIGMRTRFCPGGACAARFYRRQRRAELAQSAGTAIDR